MRPAKTLHTTALALVLAGTAATTAQADESPEPRALPPPHSVGLFAGVGALGSPGATGGAFLAGLRLGVGKHFAASVDLGYGLLTAPPTIQDRWWLMPSAALVIPAGSVRLDLGVGAGVGTSSGYLSWSDYDARPFTPSGTTPSPPYELTSSRPSPWRATSISLPARTSRRCSPAAPLLVERWTRPGSRSGSVWSRAFSSSALANIVK